MIQKLLILSGIIMSVTCTVIHQFPMLYADNTDYNFAYEVNHPPTGDIKNVQESRQGDTVIGQYSLLQPDGIRRIVDYTADDLRGFRSTIINRPANDEMIDNNNNNNRKVNEINDNRIKNLEAPSSGQESQKASLPGQLPPSNVQWSDSQNEWPTNTQSIWPSNLLNQFPSNTRTDGSHVPSVAVSTTSFVQTINSHRIPQPSNNVQNRKN